MWRRPLDLAEIPIFGTISGFAGGPVRAAEGPAGGDDLPGTPRPGATGRNARGARPAAGKPRPGSTACMPATPARRGRGGSFDRPAKASVVTTGIAGAQAPPRRSAGAAARTRTATDPADGRTRREPARPGRPAAWSAFRQTAYPRVSFAPQNLPAQQIPLVLRIAPGSRTLSPRPAPVCMAHPPANPRTPRCFGCQAAAKVFLLSSSLRGFSAIIPPSLSRSALYSHRPSSGDNPLADRLGSLV